MPIQFLNKETIDMTLYEKIFSKDNTRETILKDSEAWISTISKCEECVEKNIPANEAISHLIALIKQSGDWKDE